MGITKMVDFKRGDYVVESETGRVACVEEMNEDRMTVRYNRRDEDGNDVWEDVEPEEFHRFR